MTYNRSTPPCCVAVYPHVQLSLGRRSPACCAPGHYLLCPIRPPHGIIVCNHCLTPGSRPGGATLQACHRSESCPPKIAGAASRAVCDTARLPCGHHFGLSGCCCCSLSAYYTQKKVQGCCKKSEVCHNSMLLSLSPWRILFQTFGCRPPSGRTATSTSTLRATARPTPRTCLRSMRTS